MTVTTTKVTLSEEVYAMLRADLLNGVLVPGSRLKLAAFSTRFGVSLSVVREAMTRLAEQGLVVANPQRGFSVAPLSVADLRDLTRARVLIETMALRESIKHGDVAWESTVVASLHTLERTPISDEHGVISESWCEAHRNFHESLLAGSGSSRLQNIATSLRDCAELYRLWSRTLAHDEDRNLDAEHRQIMEVTLARNAELASTALADHIERTTAALLNYAETHPV